MEAQNRKRSFFNSNDPVIALINVEKSYQEEDTAAVPVINRSSLSLSPVEYLVVISFSLIISIYLSIEINNYIYDYMEQLENSCRFLSNCLLD